MGGTGIFEGARGTVRVSRSLPTVLTVLPANLPAYLSTGVVTMIRRTGTPARSRSQLHPVRAPQQRARNACLSAAPGAASSPAHSGLTAALVAAAPTAAPNPTRAPSSTLVRVTVPPPPPPRPQTNIVLEATRWRYQVRA